MNKKLRLLVRSWIHRLLWRSLFNNPEVTNGYIFTTDGFLEESTLKRKHIRQKTPQGYSYATEYYSDGRLVRRDVTQDVQRGMPPIELFTQGEAK